MMFMDKAGPAAMQQYFKAILHAINSVILVAGPRSFLLFSKWFSR